MVHAMEDEYNWSVYAYLLLNNGEGIFIVGRSLSFGMDKGLDLRWAFVSIRASGYPDRMARLNSNQWLNFYTSCCLPF